MDRMTILPGVSVARHLPCSGENYERWMAPIWESLLIALLVAGLPAALIGTYVRWIGADARLPSVLWRSAGVFLIILSTWGKWIAVDLYRRCHPLGRRTGRAPWEIHWISTAFTVAVSGGMLILNILPHGWLSISVLLRGAVAAYGFLHVVLHIAHNLSHIPDERL